MSDDQKLNSHTLVLTEDSSYTLWSDRFEEHCHSICGAKEETDHNYIQATNLIKRASNQPKLTILEVGLGTGLGYQQTLHALENSNCFIDFYSLEIELELIEWVKSQKLNSRFPLFSSLKSTNEGIFNSINDYGALTIIAGDALNTLPKALIPPVNIIFQDPFSPQKNPTLWSDNWFKLLFQKAADDCVMTTYSSSVSVQKAMRQAGWQVEKFKGYAKKREALRAFKRNSF